MKKKIIIGIFCLLCLCGCENTKHEKTDYMNKNDEQLEKEIIANLNNIEEVTDTTSSNPYEYTKNEYYENIVKLGNDAVFVLKNMYENKKLTGVNAYISALAIQDITKCNLYDEYGLDWSTAEEFYSLWENNNCSFNK